MLRLLLSLCCLLAATSIASAAESLPLRFGDQFQPWRWGGATGRLELVWDAASPQAELVLRLTPLPLGPGESGGPLSFYAPALPAGLPGLATRLSLADGAPAKPIGEARHDLAIVEKNLVEGMAPIPVFTPGALTLRQTIQLPVGDGRPVPVALLLDYMLCNDQLCRPPVRGGRLEILLPSHPAGFVAEAPAPALPLNFGDTGQPWEWGGVRGTLTLERADEGPRATLVLHLDPLPVAADEIGGPMHFYGPELPPGLPGEPTRMELAPGQPDLFQGPARFDQVPVPKDLLPDLPPIPLFPDGPVTLRQDLLLPQGSGAPQTLRLRLSWMACNAEMCRPSVYEQELAIALPSHPEGLAADGTRLVEAAESTVRARAVETPPAAPPRPRGSGPVLLRLLGVGALGLLGLLALARRPGPWRLVLASAALGGSLLLVAGFAPDYGVESEIRWRHPTTVAEVETEIAQAHARGRAALLDFTGPSCVNCQMMAKGPFTRPDIAAAWNSQHPIEVDTDPPYQALARWQQERFGTQTRPLYVRIAPDGSETRWTRVFTKGDDAAAAELVAFLDGSAAGEGSGGSLDAGLIGFVLLALAGGLFTLVMPCTYPMIPLTVNFFTKQAAAGRRLAPLAGLYALGIMAFFVGLGLLVGALLGEGVSAFAGHWMTNLGIGLLFIVLGLSLLGVFLLQLPAGLEARLGGSRSGYLGALAMGLTFAITAFACTAPFAGLVLAEAATQGTWLRAGIGMAIYSSVIAGPFFLLALAPGLMTRLPRAGAWMAEFKVVGGLVEIGAALKFLAITDHAFRLGWIGRELSLAAWAVLAALCASYLLGLWRMRDDEPVARLGAGRLLCALIFAVFAAWLVAGLLGLNTGLFESFFPGDLSPA